MAIDTPLKRYSATGVLMPFRGGCYPGTSGVVQAEKQVVSYLYSGVLALSITITGVMRMAFVGKAPAMTFSGKQPGIGMVGKKPSMTFQGKE